MNLAGLSIDSEEFLFKPVLTLKGSFCLINTNKKISYIRARECIVSKLAIVAPNLKLVTHTLRASGASSAANADGIYLIGVSRGMVDGNPTRQKTVISRIL